MDFNREELDEYYQQIYQEQRKQRAEELKAAYDANMLTIEDVLGQALTLFGGREMSASEFEAWQSDWDASMDALVDEKCDLGDCLPELEEVNGVYWGEVRECPPTH